MKSIMFERFCAFDYGPQHDLSRASGEDEGCVPC